MYKEKGRKTRTKLIRQLYSVKPKPIRTKICEGCGIRFPTHIPSMTRYCSTKCHNKKLAVQSAIKRRTAHVKELSVGIDVKQLNELQSKHSEEIKIFCERCNKEITDCVRGPVRQYCAVCVREIYLANTRKKAKKYYENKRRLQNEKDKN